MKKLLWFVYDFNVAGGGERYVIEGVRFLSKKNIDHNIVCVRFRHFEFIEPWLKIKPLLGESRISVLVQSLIVILRLRKTIIEYAPSQILCQDFRGYVFVYLATLFSSYRYSILDFGQMFQFDDHHIIHSRFYRDKVPYIKPFLNNVGEEVPNSPPRLALVQKLINEIKGYLLYKAFLRSEYLFTLSEKVQKEDLILYGKKSIILKGAYSDTLFGYKIKKDIRALLGLKKNKIVLSIGRLAKNKRIDLLIRGFSRLIQLTPDALLLIGGRGQELANLTRLVNDLGIQDQVRFLGFIPEEDLYDYYCACDVFTTMDNADFDITTYVALGLGKNVVWPNVMEIDDNLRQIQRIFTANPDEISIGKALHRAISQIRQSSARNEREILMKYTWDSCFQNLSEKIA